MGPDQKYELFRQLLTHLFAFLILFAILKALLWEPILKVLDDRGEKIADEFEKAESRQAEFEKLKADYEERLAEIERETRDKINEAVAKGEKLREEILAKASREAEEMRDRVERETRAKVDAAAIELKDRLVDITLGATEKLLRERLDGKKHRELVEEFIDRVSAN